MSNLFDGDHVEWFHRLRNDSNVWIDPPTGQGIFDPLPIIEWFEWLFLSYNGILYSFSKQRWLFPSYQIQRENLDWSW